VGATHVRCVFSVLSAPAATANDKVWVPYVRSYLPSSPKFISLPGENKTTCCQNAFFFYTHQATGTTSATHRLLSLPEEILLLIMELLDATSIQFLRRTNRIFLRLFSSPCFRGQHNLELIGIPQPSKIPYFLWARPSRDIEAAGHTPLFVRYLEREAKKLCRDCKVAAGGLTGFQRMQSKSLVNKSLLRTGCEVYHPMMYFSSAQRQPWMDATRICIGREDHVRLSEHLVIGWDALVEAARDLKKRDPGSKDDTMATPGTLQPLL